MRSAQILFHTNSKLTPRYFGNRGVVTPRFPKYRGVAHLLKAKNSLASRFTVGVNLQAHATVFKAKNFQQTV